MENDIKEIDGKQYGRLDEVGVAWLAKNLRALADQVEREPTYLASANFAAKVVEVPCPGTCGTTCRAVHREFRPGSRAALVDLQWDVPLEPGERLSEPAAWITEAAATFRTQGTAPDTLATETTT
jgi:hypothetical protein